MNTSAKYDAIEQLIFDEQIRIEAVDIHSRLDTFIILLNTKAVLKLSLSTFPGLKNATQEQLNEYTLIANGTGVHWPLLDEDLSLKGFLQQELKRTVGNKAA